MNTEYNLEGLALEIRNFQSQKIKVDEMRRHLSIEEAELERMQNKLFLIANKVYANS